MSQDSLTSKQATSSSSESFNGNQQKPLVVIIGAGLAGLSSAYKLIELGHENILILEASNRVGGRIESFMFSDGAQIDLGAQWLHGEVENPIYSWLKDDLDLIDCVEEEEVEFEGLFRTNLQSNESLEKQEFIVAKCLEILLDAKRILYEMSTNLTTKCIPIEVYRKHFYNECSSNPMLQNVDKNLLNSVLSWFELYETIDNSCEDLTKLSIRAYSDWTDFDKGKMVKLKGGWSSVVYKLLEFVGKEKIVFNCSVERIEHSSEGVKIKYNNNEFNEIMCHHCIITIPLGVMQNLNLETFLYPPLESKRIELIKKLGFGAVNKIFLQFDEPFLQEERGLKLLWLAENHNNNDQDQKETKPTLPNWTKYMTGFDLVPGHDNILLAWIGGVGAEEMEHYSEEEIGVVCLKVLEIFLPEKRVPKLKSIKKSSWFSDRNFRGSYSYESTKTVNSDTQDLWKPIYWLVENDNDRRHHHQQQLQLQNQQQGQRQVLKPRVQFAGEATALTMYATAHGAIISGWREAERLKRYI